MAEAPAEKSLEILSQEITCSACRRHYESPKALPCCHYFCESCVRGLADNEFATGQQIACPECGRLAALPPGGVSHLPDVHFVKRLKELHTRMAMIQRKIEAYCELCSTEKAQSFCHQCAEFMCYECAKSHSKMTKKYPGHRVAALDQLQESGARTRVSAHAQGKTGSAKCSVTTAASWCVATAQWRATGPTAPSW